MLLRLRLESLERVMTGAGRFFFGKISATMVIWAVSSSSSEVISCTMGPVASMAESSRILDGPALGSSVEGPALVSSLGAEPC